LVNPFYIKFHFKKNNVLFIIVTNKGKLLYSNTLKKIKYSTTNALSLTKEVLSRLVACKHIQLLKNENISTLLCIYGYIRIEILLVIIGLFHKQGLLLLGVRFHLNNAHNGVKLRK